MPTATISATYGIFTEDGLDATLYHSRAAQRHARELRDDFDCNVKVLKATGKGSHDDALDDVEAHIRFKGRMPGARSIDKIATKHNVTLTIARV